MQSCFYTRHAFSQAPFKNTSALQTDTELSWSRKSPTSIGLLTYKMEWRKEHRILRISTAYKGRKKQDLATHTTAIGTGTPLRRHLLCTVCSPRFSAWKRELWSGPFLEGSISLHSRPRGGVSALGPQSQPRTTPEAKLPSPESLALIPHPHGLLPRATFLGPDTLNKHILLKALAIYHRL